MHTFYYTSDGLGSVLNVADANGTSQVAYAYNTFGSKFATQAPSGAPSNELQFIGQRLDQANSNVDLYDTTVRNLDTSTGRFLTQDPAGNSGQTAGTYVYGNDNPDTYADPRGTNSGSSDVGCRDTKKRPPDVQSVKAYVKWCWDSTNKLTDVEIHPKQDYSYGHGYAKLLGYIRVTIKVEAKHGGSGRHTASEIFDAVWNSETDTLLNHSNNFADVYMWIHVIGGNRHLYFMNLPNYTPPAKDSCPWYLAPWC